MVNHVCISEMPCRTCLKKEKVFFMFFEILPGFYYQRTLGKRNSLLASMVRTEELAEIYLKFIAMLNMTRRGRERDFGGNYFNLK